MCITIGSKSYLGWALKPRRLLLHLNDLTDPWLAVRSSFYIIDLILSAKPVKPCASVVNVDQNLSTMHQIINLILTNFLPKPKTKGNLSFYGHWPFLEKKGWL